MGEAVWQELNDVRRVVLVDMSFQMGVSGLSKLARLREAIACSAWDAAEKELLDSLYAKQTPARALRNAEMLRTGKVA